MRVTASEYRPEEWDTTECGLLVFMIGLETGPFRYMFAIHTLAHGSLHAIGRRSQCGLDATEAAILHDLRALGVAHHALADRPDGTEFAVPTSGGAWRGSVQLVRDPRTDYYDKALAARTFGERNLNRATIALLCPLQNAPTGVDGPEWQLPACAGSGVKMVILKNG